MANCKAAKKYIKVTERNRERNQDQKSKVKTLIKHARISIEEKSVDRVELVFNAIRAIDKSTGNAVFHKNNAAKKKSILQSLLNASGKVTEQDKAKASAAKPAKKATKAATAKKETATATKAEAPKAETKTEEKPKAEKKETPSAEAPKAKAKKEATAPKAEKSKEKSPK